jgi:formamidopyrimidine-DNA glycosylase
MPEIPEMELYKENLNSTVRGKGIQKIWVYRPKSVNYEVDIFIDRIIGLNISNVDRKGKYLIFNLSNGLKLLAHMMLDGRLYYLTKEAAGNLESFELDQVDKLREKVPGLSGKPSVLVQFEDDSLLFFCQLTLGYLRLYEDREIRPILEELGPDPLDPQFGAEAFSQLLAKASKRGMIKPWLMQQRNIAGVGNAYSNEALFGAGILPKRTIGALDSHERVKLYNELLEVLKKSIQCGGDMEEPFSLGDDFTGGFNPYFRVYDRADKPCVLCGDFIVREEVGGRNAFYCPHCQV